MGKRLVAKYFLSYHQGDFDNEAANPFQKDDNGCQQRMNRRMFVPLDFQFDRDAKIFPLFTNEGETLIPEEI